VDIGSATLYQGDCFEIMHEMEGDSIDLIATDPPYFKVKNEAWDRQWNSADEFVAWMRRLCETWREMLKSNGSLYCFASQKMAARVEVEMSSHFNVLNRIVWIKSEGRHKGSHKESLRAYFPQTEFIVFAEHYGADNMAKGEAGYVLKCDKLRGIVFEPLRAYLDGERRRADVSQMECNVACGTGSMAKHYFCSAQFCIPTPEHYTELQRLFNAKCNGSGPQYLRREYEDLRREYEDLRREYEDLRREYEDLRREYEDLRRPFSVSADIAFTDVWNFPVVRNYRGKHPCEKPLLMMRHIISVSSRDGATVFDPFMGSGTTGVAAVQLGRKFIGIEREPKYFERACNRVREALESPSQLELVAHG